MNNIHLFPRDTYGIVLSFRTDPRIIENISNPAYKVTCILKERTIEVAVPLTAKDVATEKCSSCPNLVKNLQEKYRKEWEAENGLTKPESELTSGEQSDRRERAWDYINRQMTQHYGEDRSKLTLPACVGGINMLTQDGCLHLTRDAFHNEVRTRQQTEGVARINLPKLAIVQNVPQKRSGNFSIVGANRRNAWALFGFTDRLPKDKMDAMIAARRSALEDDQLAEYKAKLKRKGVWLAPFTMANVYTDGSICWGQINDSRKFKNHRAVLANFLGSNFNSDLTTTHQKSLKYTLENYSVLQNGEWKFNEQMLSKGDNHSFISTSEQYDGLMITDRDWLLQAVHPRYHVKIAGKRCIVAWFKKTQSPKHIWVNCNGYVLLLASIKNKCKPIQLGRAKTLK